MIVFCKRQALVITPTPPVFGVRNLHLPFRDGRSNIKQHFAGGRISSNSDRDNRTTLFDHFAGQTKALFPVNLRWPSARSDDNICGLQFSFEISSLCVTAGCRRVQILQQLSQRLANQNATTDDRYFSALEGHRIILAEKRGSFGGTGEQRTFEVVLDLTNLPRL